MAILISDFPDLAALGVTQLDLEEMLARIRDRKSALAHFPTHFVEVGTHPTVDMLVQVLESSGNLLSEWVRDLLPQVTISPRSWLNVVTPSVAELGFTAMWTPIRDIHLRGQKFGLQLVPSDLAFNLRLQYPSQPKNEVIFMAMQALRHPTNGQILFRVGRYIDGLWVGADYGRPENRCGLKTRFAFVVPQA